MAQRRRANFFAHKARQHSDIETTNTTARPQQGNSETDITSAPENCTKNAHFSPAKAMAVSIPLEHERAKATTVSVKAQPAPAKATTVSDNRTPGRQGQAPPVWRAPEGPEGTGGLRGDAPSEARGADDSRAAGPSGARNTRGTTSNPAQQVPDNGYDSETSPRGSRRDRPR